MPCYRQSSKKRLPPYQPNSMMHSKKLRNLFYYFTSKFSAADYKTQMPSHLPREGEMANHKWTLWTSPPMLIHLLCQTNWLIVPAPIPLAPRQQQHQRPEKCKKFYKYINEIL